MKKTLLILLPLLAVLLIIAVTACVLFLKLYPSSSAPTTSRDTDLLSYVQEHWQLADVQYADDTLTVRKSFDITYEQACKLGGNIFTDDLAPESYLSLVATLAADLETQFDNPPTLVLLRYCSSDGQTIFSVNSNGEISTCWQ